MDISTPKTDAMLALVQEHAGDMDARKMVPVEHARALEAELSLLKQGLPDYREMTRETLEGHAGWLANELAAVRELLNLYNLGGWTDAVAPMKRALAAEQERDDLKHDVERQATALSAYASDFDAIVKVERLAIEAAAYRRAAEVCKLMSEELVASRDDALGAANPQGALTRARQAQTADDIAAAILALAGQDKRGRWMADNVNNFASHFLQRYEKTGSLRESMMYAYVRTLDGVEAGPASAKEAANWPDAALSPSTAQEGDRDGEKRMRAALELIVAAGTKFDAKGTHSAWVVAIAEEAITREPKTP